MGKYTEKSLQALGKIILAGTPAFGKNPELIDSLFAIADEKVKRYKALFRKLDLIQYTRRIMKFNLPYGADAKIMSRILYYRGQLCFFYREESQKFYHLPFALNGEIDCYGRYLDVTPLLWRGTDDNKEDKQFMKDLTLYPIYEPLIPEQVTKEVQTKGCVIFDDRMKDLTEKLVPPYIMQEPLIELEAKLLMLIETAAMNKVGIKGIKADGPDDCTKIIQAGLSKMLFALTGTSYLPVDSSFQTIQELNDVNVNIQELFASLQAVDNFRLMQLGIQNGGLFEKQGTELQAQFAFGVSNTKLIEQDAVFNWQESCDIVNSIWGKNMYAVATSCLNMNEPNAEKQNESTATMYDNETSNGNSNSNTDNAKEGA